MGVVPAEAHHLVGPPVGVVVADRPGRPLQVDDHRPDVLVELGPHQLGHRPLRARVLGPHVLGGPQDGQPQGLGLDPQPHHPVEVDAGPLAGVHAAVGVHQHVGGLAPSGVVAADGGPLVHQRGEGHPPALAHRADAAGVGHPHVGEVDLVELGLAGHLAQGPDLHPLAVHVQGEVGQALVLGELGVGAGDEHSPVGRVGQRRPHLLAVDHPFVAVGHRPGGQTGEIRARAGLAEELAPQVGAGVHGPQEPPLLLVGAVGGDGGPGQPHEEGARFGRRGPGPAEAVLHAAVELGADSEPAEAGRQMHPGQPGIEATAPELLVADGGGVVVPQQGLDRLVDHQGLLVAGVDGGCFGLGRAHPAKLPCVPPSLVFLSKDWRYSGIWCSEKRGCGFSEQELAL